MKHQLFPADELPPGEVRRVEVDGLAIVIAHSPGGGIFALRSVCPHEGADLSYGRLKQATGGDDVDSPSLTEDFVLRCPWHGYEFDLATGRCLADPERVRVKTYKVGIENAKVVLEH